MTREQTTGVCVCVSHSFTASYRVDDRVFAVCTPLGTCMRCGGLT